MRKKTFNGVLELHGASEISRLHSLLALSFGQDELTRPMYARAVALDTARSARLAK